MEDERDEGLGQVLHCLGNTLIRHSGDGTVEKPCGSGVTSSCLVGDLDMIGIVLVAEEEHGEIVDLVGPFAPRRDETHASCSADPLEVLLDTVERLLRVQGKPNNLTSAASCWSSSDGLDAYTTMKAVVTGKYC